MNKHQLNSVALLGLSSLIESGVLPWQTREKG